MSWGLWYATGTSAPMSTITGISNPRIGNPFLPASEPSPYMEAPPAPRVWENSEDTVWCLTIDYRKPSLGDAGVLGTYRLYERAIKALAEYAEGHYDRALTE